MDYQDFLKSKHIAERWGQAQAAFEVAENSEEVAYYQAILGEFYDYIQDLEGKLFDQAVKNDPADLTDLSKIPAAENTILPDSLASSQVPVPAPFAPPAVDLTDFQTGPNLTPLPDNAPAANSSNPAGQVSTDEEDPWFGF